METVVKFAMLLVSFSFVLKLTGYKLRQLLIMALICALFVGFSWKFAAQQSKVAIQAWLSDPSLMLDTAVVMTVDVVIQMAYCLMAVNIMASGVLKRRSIIIYRLLRIFPGLMIFLVLFGLVVSLIFAFPGVSFPLISWSMAGGIILFLPLLVLVVKKLLPEKDIRLELLFLSNVLTLALGVIATVNGRATHQRVDETDLMACAGVCLMLIAGTLMGFLLHKLKAKRNYHRIK